MNNKIWSIGILLVTLISFSGLASAATVSNVGSNVVYHGTNEKYINNWYILTTSSKSSTIVFKSKKQIKKSNIWTTLINYQMNQNYLKISPSKIKVTTIGYMGIGNKPGKIVSTNTFVWSSSVTPYYLAKLSEPSVIKSMLKKLSS